MPGYALDYILNEGGFYSRVAQLLDVTAWRRDPKNGLSQVHVFVSACAVLSAMGDGVDYRRTEAHRVQWRLGSPEIGSSRSSC